MSEMGVDGERDQFMETNSIYTFLSRTKRDIILLVNGGSRVHRKVFVYSGSPK